MILPFPSVGQYFKGVRCNSGNGIWKVVSEPVRDAFGEWFIWAECVSKERRDTVWHAKTLRFNAEELTPDELAKLEREVKEKI